MCFKALIYTITTLLGFACPAFQLAKIILFNQSNGVLHLREIDYVYFGLGIAPIALLVCVFCGDFLSVTMSTLYVLGWLILPSAYTALTVHEMGDIPFTCPNSYNYSSLSLYTTCQIRKCNLIFIWLFPTLVVLSIIVSNIDSDDYDGNYSTRISNVAETTDNNISNASDVRNDSTVANNVVEVHVPNASDVKIIPNASDMKIIPNASDVKIIPNASDVISGTRLA